MSYNAKNLAYDAKEPAFLQRLRGQYGGNTTGGLERPISQRPRRARDDNEDDGPTYVDAESNEVISKEEYEAMVKGDGEEQSEQPENGVKDKDADADAEKAGDSGKKEGTTSKQNLTEIGGPRKRKQAKVVGDESQEAESEKSEEVRPKETKSQKPKQKKKKIKLSFEE